LAKVLPRLRIVEFSAKSSRPDFLVMDTAAFAATGRARAELLQKKFACRIDWRDWDCALGTNFASIGPPGRLATRPMPELSDVRHVEKQ
jgi:hypothetical protein